MEELQVLKSACCPPKDAEPVDGCTMNWTSTVPKGLKRATPVFIQSADFHPRHPAEQWLGGAAAVPGSRGTSPSASPSPSPRQGRPAEQGAPRQEADEAGRQGGDPRRRSSPCWRPATEPSRDEGRTTTEQDALIEAILDDPDDDARRLVYADWLDEHGQYGDGIRQRLLRPQVQERASKRHEMAANSPAFRQISALRLAIPG